MRENDSSVSKIKGTRMLLLLLYLSILLGSRSLINEKVINLIVKNEYIR